MILLFPLFHLVTALFNCLMPSISEDAESALNHGSYILLHVLVTSNDFLRQEHISMY